MLNAVIIAGARGLFVLADYPLLIKVAAIISIIAFLLVFITVAVIFMNRIARLRIIRAKKEAEDIIFEELNEHMLVYDSLTEIPEEQLKKTLDRLSGFKNKSAIFRRSLIKILVYFQLNLTGAITRIISAAYSRLRLREFTLSKLKSRLWFRRTQGLREVEGMKDGHSLPEVHKLTRDPNDDVRVGAYTAMIRLKAKESFDFFLTEKEELSRFHQIMLEQAIVKTEGLNIPEFKTFLSTENKSMILLSIRLILDYKQLNAIPKLMSLLDHGDEYVRNQVICALGELNSELAEHRLIDRYPKEHNANKSQILLALGHIGSGNSLDFILDKFKKADHYSILKSAAAAIFFHPEQLKEGALARLVDLDTEQENMLKHFREPLNLYGSI